MPIKRKPLTLIAYFLVLCTLFLSIILYYEVYKKDYISVHDFLKNPEENSGYNRSVMGPYGGSFEGGFYVIYNKEPVMVLYDGEYTPPRYGEVLVYGTTNKNGYVDVVGIHNYDYNYFLYAASFLAIIIVLVFFFKEWKITPRGIEDA